MIQSAAAVNRAIPEFGENTILKKSDVPPQAWDTVKLENKQINKRIKPDKKNARKQRVNNRKIQNAIVVTGFGSKLDINA